MAAPRENQMASEPATAENCAADREAAQQTPDGTQLGEARTHGNEQAGTR